MGVATEVGSVNIKVRADTRQFEKQMNGMGKLATKLGGKIAAALGTAALIKLRWLSGTLARSDLWRRHSVFLKRKLIRCLRH